MWRWWARVRGTYRNTSLSKLWEEHCLLPWRDERICAGCHSQRGDGGPEQEVSQTQVENQLQDYSQQQSHPQSQLNIGERCPEITKVSSTLNIFPNYNLKFKYVPEKNYGLWLICDLKYLIYALFFLKYVKIRGVNPIMAEYVPKMSWFLEFIPE